MEQLGIQPIQLVMQAINFIVLVVVLWKILYKPVLTMIHERQEKIKEGLNLQATMVEEKEKLAELRKKEVDKGRLEAQKIVEEARNQAKEQADKIIKETQKQSREEKEKAAKEIETMRAKLESQIKKDTVELATSMAEKVLTDLLQDEKTQRKLLEKRMRALTLIADENK